MDHLWNLWKVELTKAGVTYVGVASAENARYAARTVRAALRAHDSNFMRLRHVQSTRLPVDPDVVGENRVLLRVDDELLPSRLRTACCECCGSENVRHRAEFVRPSDGAWTARWLPIEITAQHRVLLDCTDDLDDFELHHEPYEDFILACWDCEHYENWGRFEVRPTYIQDDDFDDLAAWHAVQAGGATLPIC